MSIRYRLYRYQRLSRLLLYPETFADWLIMFTAVFLFSYGAVNLSVAVISIAIGWLSLLAKLHRLQKIIA